MISPMLPMPLVSYQIGYQTVLNKPTILSVVVFEAQQRGSPQSKIKFLIQRNSSSSSTMNSTNTKPD